MNDNDKINKNLEDAPPGTPWRLYTVDTLILVIAGPFISVGTWVAHHLSKKNRNNLLGRE